VSVIEGSTRSGLNSSVIKGDGQSTVSDIRDVRIITTRLETCSLLHVDGMWHDSRHSVAQ
jgi:hypothetical protein